MEKSAPIDAMTKIVEVLAPLSTEDRARVIRAAMALLGDPQSSVASRVGVEESTVEQGGGFINLSPRARAWMKQNGISAEELQQVFHLAEDGCEFIAAHVPGKNKKEQTYNAYVLTGLAQLVFAGNPAFQDKRARALCETFGCYDSANHSAYLRDRGNEFTGTKDKGWTLTAPGLKRAAELVRELNK
jgi:hypothetical protein